METNWRETEASLQQPPTNWIWDRVTIRTKINITLDSSDELKIYETPPIKEEREEEREGENEYSFL